MKLLNTTLLSLFVISLIAQNVIDFEEFEIEQDSFLNGSDLSGGFESGDFYIPNDYTQQWDSWSGWALSNKTDSTTPGFTNQYSCITGSGADNSENYATSFVLESSFIRIDRDSSQWTLVDMSITNSTYAYLSMKDGDAFAKKFGGESGDDPDFFLLTIKGYQDNNFLDSIDFYLADYRFENNDLDYIIDEWTSINLSTINSADSISFQLSSSDNGQFGMNTPSYFCLDDFQMGILYNTFDLVQAKEMKVHPNPTNDLIYIRHELNEPTMYIIDSYGRIVQTIKNYRKPTINLSDYKEGIYTILLSSKEYYSKQRVVKL